MSQHYSWMQKLRDGAQGCVWQALDGWPRVTAMTSDLKLGLTLAEADEFAWALGPAASAELVQGRWRPRLLGWD